MRAWLPLALLPACQVHAGATAKIDTSAGVHASGDVHIGGTQGAAANDGAPAPTSKSLLALDLDFEFDRAKLSDADRKTIADNLDAVCKLVEKHKQLTIEGHADSRGPDARNLHLSQGRAEAVRASLLANKHCHIGDSQLVAVGYGEKEPRRCHEAPACDGNDHGPKTCEECWNENRMTIISIPVEPGPAVASPALPVAPSGCSRVLVLGEERGSRMCEQPKGS